MKRTTLKDLEAIKYELVEIIEKEATNLYRLARKAKEHGVSDEVINQIREEADELRVNCTANPDRILEWRYGYRTKYAFR